MEAPTLAAFVDLYLAQHGGEPETVAKLGWLLEKAVGAFGDRRISQLRCHVRAVNLGALSGNKSAAFASFFPMAPGGVEPPHADSKSAALIR